MQRVAPRERSALLRAFTFGVLAFSSIPLWIHALPTWVMSPLSDFAEAHDTLLEGAQLGGTLYIFTALLAVSICHYVLYREPHMVALMLSLLAPLVGDAIVSALDAKATFYWPVSAISLFGVVWFLARHSPPVPRISRPASPTAALKDNSSAARRPPAPAADPPTTLPSPESSADSLLAGDPIDPQSSLSAKAKWVVLLTTGTGVIVGAMGLACCAIDWLLCRRFFGGGVHGGFEALCGAAGLMLGAHPASSFDGSRYALLLSKLVLFVLFGVDVALFGDLEENDSECGEHNEATMAMGGEALRYHSWPNAWTPLPTDLSLRSRASAPFPPQSVPASTVPTPSPPSSLSSTPVASPSSSASTMSPVASHRTATSVPSIGRNASKRVPLRPSRLATSITVRSRSASVGSPPSSSSPSIGAPVPLAAPSPPPSSSSTSSPSSAAPSSSSPSFLSALTSSLSPRSKNNGTSNNTTNNSPSSSSLPVDLSTLNALEDVPVYRRLPSTMPPSTRVKTRLLLVLHAVPQVSLALYAAFIEPFLARSVDSDVSSTFSSSSSSLLQPFTLLLIPLCVAPLLGLLLRDLLHRCDVFRTRCDSLLSTAVRAESIAARSLRDLARIRSKKRIHKCHAAEAEAFVVSSLAELKARTEATLGAASIVADAAEIPADQRAYIKSLETSARSLMSFVQQATVYTNAISLELEAKPFSLESLLESIISRLHLAGNAYFGADRDIDVTYFIDDDVPQNLIGDPQQIALILDHMLQNALKFTHKGEVVLKVSKSNVPPRSTSAVLDDSMQGEEGDFETDAEEKREPDVILEFSIKDTGIGVSPDFLPDLFKPFSSPTLKKYGGHGLGLSICHRLAGRFPYGRIGVTSHENSGSTFTFSAGFRIDPVHRRAEGLAVSIAGVPVFVIDDNPNVCLRIKKQLRVYGCIVDSALSWAKGLNKLNKSGKYKVLLLDYKMPGKSGIEVYKLIQEQYQLRDLAVIMMCPAETKEEIYSACPGLAGHLSKPIKKEQLLNVMLNHHSNNRRNFSDSPNGVHSINNSQTNANNNRDHDQSDNDDNNNNKQQQLKVLVAEDNAMNQKLLKNLVQKAGHECVIASNGAEALEQYKKRKFDVIFMDILMPVMNGIEATKRIRELEITADVTSHDKDNDEEKTKTTNACCTHQAEEEEQVKAKAKDKGKDKETENEADERKETEKEASIENRSDATNTANHTVIIALTGDDSREMCLQAGMDDYVAKPVKKEALFAMLQKIYDQKMAKENGSSNNAAGDNNVNNNGDNNDQKPKARLLLVEDNAVNARIGTHVLRKHSFEVDVAQNGKIAFDIFSSDPDKYQLVLMDIHMPVMDGVTCTRLIREFESNQGRSPVPIIALTADTTARQKNLCLEVGCNEYISKPINYPHLLETVSRFLAQAEPSVTAPK